MRTWAVTESVCNDLEIAHNGETVHQQYLYLNRDISAYIHASYKLTVTSLCLNFIEGLLNNH